jgi:hypothetical protein
MLYCMQLLGSAYLLFECHPRKDSNSWRKRGREICDKFWDLAIKIGLSLWCLHIATTNEVKRLIRSDFE